VLNASPTSLGINQRAHWSIDSAAAAAQIPYTTIRPAIFTASLLAGAAEIRARRAWTGIADTGQVGLIDHTDVADVAARILTDPATWETHYDLTGPMLLTWPRAMTLLSAKLGYLISFETLPERQLLTRLIEAGVSPGQAELLIAREWAIQAGENDRLTGTVRELTGHAPRTVEAFLHDNRRQFLQTGASSLPTTRAGTGGPGSFAFSNLSGRAPGRFLRTASRLLAGVGKVEHQVAPYAASWHERNIAALGTAGPLWVVLGDSISQGVGASSVEQGWVLQAWRILAGQGIHYRIVNLSISGATTTDVIEREIPAMNGLAAAPALVTVFIGSNDILHHDLRMNLAAHYQALIGALPADSLIAVTSQARGALAEINRTVAAAAATGAIQAVPVRIAQGKRAEDHFHPSDEGYALIAADFAAAIAAHDRRTPVSGGDETSGRQRPAGDDLPTATGPR
jgi:lysophospholipase L1-like esterase